MTDTATQPGTTIRYCKGHGWQVLAGVDLDLEVARDCRICVVVDREVR